MFKIGVLGATGYTGVELLRILSGHPKVEITYAGTHSHEGAFLHEVYPHLKEHLELQGSSLSSAAECDLIFTALPQGESKKWVGELRAECRRVIDLSPDFRLSEIYGLPEIGIREEIAKASLIANPGCYPTSCLLAILPALRAGIIESEGILFDAKSGVSGAGRTLSLTSHFGETAESIKAYHLAGEHRHTLEIETILEKLIGKPVIIQFSPHLVPMVRGLLTTSYFHLREKLSAQEIWEIYEKVYAHEPFVRLQPLGKWPSTKQVRGSNYCDIGLTVDVRTGKLIVVSVLDNLIKGASGQAIQNMNLMLGIEETEGLKTLTPLYP